MRGCQTLRVLPRFEVVRRLRPVSLIAEGGGLDVPPPGPVPAQAPDGALWALEDGRSGTSVDIDAESVGHDLMWGTANYRRNVQDRAASTAVGEETAGDDLPADLDLETGELVGTVADGMGESADEGPDDPFTAAEVPAGGRGTMGE